MSVSIRRSARSAPAPDVEVAGDLDDTRSSEQRALGDRGLLERPVAPSSRLGRDPVGADRTTRWRTRRRGEAARVIVASRQIASQMRS